MHYELYIDLFFLINFLMDYFLLLMVGKMLKCRIRRLRIIAGAMVGAFLTCIFVVFLRGKIWRLVLFHGVMNMCLLKTGLWIKEKRTLIKAWILLYVSAFLLGGILNVFQPYVRGGAVFLILAFAGYHLCLGIWDLLAYFHKNEEKWVEKPLVAVSERQKLSNVYDMILNPDDL